MFFLGSTQVEMDTLTKAAALISPSNIRPVNSCIWPMGDLQGIIHGVSTL
jgi:hypothetical protein